MMGEPSLTLNEQLFGTPGYIAPEYVAGAPIDGRADIYSLAVVIYEMVTGRLPFEGRGQSDLLLKPLTAAPIPPSARVSGLPPELEVLLLRCLSRDPQNRPHDAFALHDALQEILKRHTKSDRPAEVPRADTRPPLPSREPVVTMVDRPSSPRLSTELETADVGKLVTSEMSARWASALVELETAITRGRRAGGDSALVAARAAELAIVAGEMVPRAERAARVVADLQAKVDRLEAIGREFRANLGHAIDVLVHDRSRERAHLEALSARRQTLEQSIRDEGSWELGAVSAEAERANGVIADLDFQIRTLQSQLDAKNEAHELSLMQATGTLEGSLSALRHLTNEVARTIDDGIEMLEHVGATV
jgi:serine/threonine-protein kinase